MNEIFTARIIEDGDEQIVVLPNHCRLSGTEVQVSRHGSGVLFEPVKPRISPAEIDAIFAELSRLAALDGEFMPDGREQPPMPPDEDIDPSTAAHVSRISLRLP